MIADVAYNDLKKIGMAGGSYLVYDSPFVMEIYHINQGPVVFRAKIKKNEKTSILALQMDLKDVIQIKEPINDKDPQIKELKDVFERLELFLKLKR